MSSLRKGFVAFMFIIVLANLYLLGKRLPKRKIGPGEQNAIFLEGGIMVQGETQACIFIIITLFLIIHMILL
jgi:hypothetical protein